MRFDQSVVLYSRQSLRQLKRLKFILVLIDSFPVFLFKFSLDVFPQGIQSDGVVSVWMIFFHFRRVFQTL